MYILHIYVSVDPQLPPGDEPYPFVCAIWFRAREKELAREKEFNCCPPDPRLRQRLLLCE